MNNVKIAMLFRTAYTSMPLQSEMIKRGIRFRLFGGRKFYETAHVGDVIWMPESSHELRDRSHFPMATCGSHVASCGKMKSRIPPTTRLIKNG